MSPLTPTTSPRIPDLERSFLTIVLLVCGTVTLPQAVSIGPTSGLGAWTIVISCGAWALWLLRPYFPRELLWTLLPLALFTIFATFSLAWGGTTVEALQNLAVSVGFFGFILLTARECERSPAFAQGLHRAMDVASVLAALGYTLTVLLQGPGGEIVVGGRPVFLARPFALFATVAVARQIARWMGGDRRGLWTAVWLVALIFLSHSRLGMAASLALFPLAFVACGERGGLTKALVMTAVGAGVLVGAVTLSDDLYRRFFRGDTSLEVGGFSFNASGRTEAWEALLADMNGSAKLFGKGAGSSANFVAARFEYMSHPHNDFLRFYYDYGAFGLTWWVLFLVGVSVVLLLAVRRAVRHRDRAELPYHLAPLLALAAVCASMFTDNSISYVFIMAPLGMLIGCSLSRLGASRAVVAAPPVTLSAPAQAAPLVPARRRKLLLPEPVAPESTDPQPVGSASADRLLNPAAEITGPLKRTLPADPASTSQIDAHT